jgi:hypothetical protein
MHSSRNGSPSLSRIESRIVVKVSLLVKGINVRQEMGSFRKTICVMVTSIQAHLNCDGPRCDYRTAWPALALVERKQMSVSCHSLVKTRSTVEGRAVTLKTVRMTRGCMPIA